MRVRFWGVRGSIPVPGASTIKYGGNTSCVSINFDTDKILILDAGTGIRELGKQLSNNCEEIFILLSHHHWDHIQGFPFFLPIYESQREIHLFPCHDEENTGTKIICSLMDQMDGAHFPIKPDDLPSMSCTSKDVADYIKKNGLSLSCIPTNHPGGGYGFRIEKGGHSIVYLTDNELDPPYKKITEFEKFVHFCMNTDILIHDAQYLENDMPQKHGWGHSVVSQVCILASEAKVKHLILTHHDPDRTDAELDTIQKWAKAWFKKNNHPVQCSAAYEGLTLNL